MVTGGDVTRRGGSLLPGRAPTNHFPSTTAGGMGPRRTAAVAVGVTVCKPWRDLTESREGCYRGGIGGKENTLLPRHRGHKHPGGGPPTVRQPGQTLGLYLFPFQGVLSSEGRKGGHRGRSQRGFLHHQERVSWWTGERFSGRRSPRHPPWEGSWWNKSGRGKAGIVMYVSAFPDANTGARPNSRSSPRSVLLGNSRQAFAGRAVVVTEPASTPEGWGTKAMQGCINDNREPARVRQVNSRIVGLHSGSPRNGSTGEFWRGG